MWEWFVEKFLLPAVLIYALHKLEERKIRKLGYRHCSEVLTRVSHLQHFHSDSSFLYEVVVIGFITTQK